MMTGEQVAESICEAFEGRRRKPYKCPAGIWTTGIGHAILPGEEALMHEISDEQVDRLFEQDISKAVNAVDKLVTVDLNEQQRGALVSFVFNAGINAFAGSTLLKLVNKGDYEGAELQFKRWNKATVPITGKLVVIAGLTRRRACEAFIFGGGNIETLKKYGWQVK